MQQPNIVKIWRYFLVDKDEDEVKNKYFSPSENQKINEALARNESKVLDLDDKTVDLSSNEVFFKSSGMKGIIFCSDKLVPHLFSYISMTDENKWKFLKHSIFEDIYMSKFIDFYYASLFGVLRAVEIEQIPLESSLLFGSITKEKIYQNLNFDVYLQISFDHKYEDSVHYFERLSLLYEGNEAFSKKAGFKSTKLLSMCQKLISIYRKNQKLFSDKRQKTQFFLQLTDPFFWIMNRLLSEFPDICYDKSAFFATNLSEAQRNEMKQLFTSKNPIFQISSNIVSWSSRDMAENLGNTIFEFIFDDLKCGIQLNAEKILIPRGNYFKIINFDVNQEKNIIQLKALHGDANKIDEEEENENENQAISKENIDAFIALQRIAIDLEECTNFAYFPLNKERTHLKFVIPGKGLYEKGLFQLDVKIPSKFPHEPPQVKFDTKIIHPNVDAKTGQIDLNEYWTAVMTIENLLCKIQSLLYKDDIDSKDLKEGITNDAKKCVEVYADKSEILNEMKQNDIYGLQAHRKLIEQGDLVNFL